VSRNIFVRHIDDIGHNEPCPQDERNDTSELELKLYRVIRAGNAIVGAQTPTERVIAIHDWKEAIK
jgi:hypothetical protein